MLTRNELTLPWTYPLDNHFYQIQDRNQGAAAQQMGRRCAESTKEIEIAFN